MIDSLQIGRIYVENVQALVLDDKALDGTLIGMSFLKRLDKFEVADGALVLVAVRRDRVRQPRAMTRRSTDFCAGRPGLAEIAVGGAHGRCRALRGIVRARMDQRQRLALRAPPRRPAAARSGRPHGRPRPRAACGRRRARRRQARCRAWRSRRHSRTRGAGTGRTTGAFGR